MNFLAEAPYIVESPYRCQRRPTGTKSSGSSSAVSLKHCQTHYRKHAIAARSGAMPNTPPPLVATQITANATTHPPSSGPPALLRDESGVLQPRYGLCQQ